MTTHNDLWTVYIHLNKINGKAYVGITRLPPSQRWGNEGYGYKTQPFYKAIKKYGWENFEHFIFASGLTMEEAVNMESTLIVKLESLISQHGYNSSLGGEYSISKSKRVGRYSPYGLCLQVYPNIQTAAEEMGLNYSSIYDACIGRSYTSGRYGWRYIDDYEGNDYLDISSEFPRDIYECYYPLLQFDKEGKLVNRYSNAYDLPKEFRPDYVLDCCRGILKRSHGYSWAFEIDVLDVDNFRPRKWNNYSVRARAVVQLTLDGDYIRRFNSAFEAGKTLNYSASTIAQVCRGNGRTKTTHGYRFEYEDNYLKGIHNTLPSDYNYTSSGKNVIQKTANGITLATFNSVTDAARSVGLKRNTSISNVINTGKIYHGYIWECPDRKGGQNAIHP